MKKLLVVAIACLFVAGFSATAKAAVLAPVVAGSTLEAYLNPTVAFTAPNYANTATAFTGTLDESVYLDATGMIFEYQFTNTSGSTTLKDPIITMANSDFSGFTTTQGYVTGGGQDPILESNVGDTISFSFSGVTPGTSSDVLWIQTNAPAYNYLGSAYFQDGGNVSVGDYGPATPEPATMLMFGMGALGLVGLRKRKLA